jgi:hypothetical protein
MLMHPARLAAALAVATVLINAPVPAHAGVASLQVDATQVHRGEPVTVTANFCPTGNTVTTLQYVTHGLPKSPVMTLPLDPTAAGLVQDASGFRFAYTPVTDRETLWFNATCSNSTSATTETTKVTVFPPMGEHWFLSPYGELGASPGTDVTLTVTSMDCDNGSMGTFEIIGPGGSGPVIATGSADITSGTAEATLTIPLGSTPGADYSAVFTCTAEGHGTLRGGDPFTVFGDAPPVVIPETGRSAVLAWFAGAFLLVGLVLRALAGRSMRRSATTDEP